MKLVTMWIILFLTSPYCQAQCGTTSVGKNSTVAIALTNGLGHPLSTASYSVREFINLKSKKDLSGLFGVNPKMGPLGAEHVPFGTYQIKIQARSDSDVFGRLVDVCQANESIEVPNHFARVHVVLLITSVNSVEDAGIGLVHLAAFRSADGTEMAGLFNGAVADKVPYGSYDLEWFDPLGGLIKRQVDVFQHDVWVYSGLSARYGDRPYSGPENIVSGKVENIPANEWPVFVTMSGVYISRMINSTVTDTGTFSLAGVNPDGVYMLFTIGRSGILDAREFQLPRESGMNADIIVDLSHPSPPKKPGP